MHCSSPTGVRSTGTAVGLSPTGTGALPCTMGVSICGAGFVSAEGVRQIPTLFSWVKDIYICVCGRCYYSAC